MERFIYHNKSFTLIELLIYIGTISIIGILTMILFYAIIFYSNVYIDKYNIRSEMFKVLHKLYLNNIYSTSIESMSDSIKFNLSPSGFERIFSSGTNLYIENQLITDKFTSDKIDITNFNISTSGSYTNIFIKIQNKHRNQSLSATSTIYPWNY